jgi:nitrogen regulatory protein P-II 1
VTAIVRSVALEEIEKRLQDLRVPGFSVTKVKGHGEYENFFRHDRMTEHVRIEIFLRRERVDEIARGIIDAAQTGLAGDGIVVVLPVEAVYRIRTGELATSDDLGGSGHVPQSEVADPGKE